MLLQVLLQQLAQPCAPLQVVTQTVQVESVDSQKALVELQVKNGSLQEQLSLQRKLLQELEAQLHDSQRTCTQLRTQVRWLCFPSSDWPSFLGLGVVH